MRIKKLKHSPAKVEQIDTNKDGQISQEEWDAAVARLEQELLGEEMQSYQGGESPDVVIGQGKTEKIFIISGYSQKELTKKLSWQALLGVLGGAILALSMLALLIFSS